MQSRVAVSLLVACWTSQQVAASCAYGTHLHARQEGEAVPINTFGYSGAISPLNWLSLDPAANIACSTGKSQSPIDMVAGQFTLVPAASLQLTIPDIEETEFENLGTTVEVIVPQGAGAGMVVDGTQFDLKQFHFHLPSEHLDNGTSFAMEMHMVFESAAQQIAVVGVYLDASNMASAETIPAAAVERRHSRDTTAPAKDKRQVQVFSVPTQAGASGRQTSLVEAMLAALGFGLGQDGSTLGAAGLSDPSSLVVATGGTSLLDTIFASVGTIAAPGTRTKIGPLVMADLVASLNAGEFQSYGGSLTTPPCSEGVSWFVATAKQSISVQSFAAARDVIGFNSRFPQNALGQDNSIALALQSNVQAQAVPAPVA